VWQELQKRFTDRRLNAALAVLMAVSAFGLRIDRIGFNSLSEDETAKWQAIQQYRQGHFAGVNSEHPMLMKVLAWTSVATGERWNKLAAAHQWPSMRIEGWLRLPNVLLGAATAAVLFLFCRELMGLAGSLAAGFFWAFSPLAISLNRLLKEETIFVFFTLLACYFYLRAKQADTGQKTQRWLDLSAAGFGLAVASQYILHFLGLNALAWYIAGRRGIRTARFTGRFTRFFVLVFLTVLIADPVIVLPANLTAILHWLHHDGIRHTGYNFDGTLYYNFPARLLAGVPWYYYLFLLLVKTPIPILAFIVLGCVLLLRRRDTLASCFFLSFGVLQLTAMSICGAKWMRYSLWFLPAICLAGGYAVQETCNFLRTTKVSAVVAGVAALGLFACPLAELHSWAPYYSFYLNSFGGGTRNVARYFAPDDVSEFDTREVAQAVCPTAPAGSRLATARPNSMAFYLSRCGRSDIQIIPLYDPKYVARGGDLVVLEPSRRFFETQRFFNVLETSSMAGRDIHVGPVMASMIYDFQPGQSAAAHALEELAASQSAQPEFPARTASLDSAWTVAQSILPGTLRKGTKQ
jgi:Dolichyl-phosphate-mannose-protein mannosyltransferase